MESHKTSLQETLRRYAEGKSELLRQLAKRHGVEVEVIDIPMEENELCARITASNAETR